MKSGPRKWTEVPALFSSPVSDQWSGGIAFSYFKTEDAFGMTTLSADNKTITVSGEVSPRSRAHRLDPHADPLLPCPLPAHQSLTRS